MEAHAAAATPADLATAHPDGAALMPEPGRDARVVAWLCVGTGLALFAVMGILGLLMRLTQADAIGISPEWFYRLMTLHGAGMLAGAMLAMMGALWFVVRPVAPLSYGRMLVSYASVVLGAVAVVVAVIIGGSPPGGRSSPRCPSSPPSSGPPGRRSSSSGACRWSASASSSSA